METMKTRKQVGPTFMGKTAEREARKWRHDLFEANDNPSHPAYRTIATPWADWTIERTNLGWAVFVTEQE